MGNLQSRIKSTRVSLGLSQSALAQKTGVSQPTVANWENGSHIPRQAVLEKIGIALGVTTSWLISGTRESDEIPAQIYLQTPVRHVPIFEWPAHGFELSTEAPIGFTPFASRKEGLFGVISRRDDAFTILICHRNDNRELRTGEYLVNSGHHVEQMANIDINQEKVIGRILAEMKFYP